ncbi:MAG TPA: phosphoribosylformylglycinamidine synthase subunit PurQ [Campylobacteraceae bacterium]|jgi:phosphoribosylformylglycinamidine synthase I|nr:phosphoribosylformylglycinamidine synthase subunit PurQ [Campylobacteraceae bacterium]
MKTAIVVFPGTNCDYDTEYACKLMGSRSVFVWHKETTLPEGSDLVILPGGFSYGDALRSGAIARFSPIMQAVVDFAKKGGRVLGICNGFQILLESHLLPGAMKRNQNLHFISKYHHLRVQNSDNPFLSALKAGDIVHIPMAHGEGNYYIDDAQRKALWDHDQVLLTYCDAEGNVDNPNGSVDAIAGICNREKNVFGLMPHPERAMETLLGSDDGVAMLEGLFH